jgi:hypothetical protein
MTWMLDAPGPDEACDAPMTRRDLILPRVEACIMAVTPRAGWVREDSTQLLRDLWLTGEGIARLGELLEEEFGITLNPTALYDLLLTNPTLGGVLRMLEQRGA